MTPIKAAVCRSFGEPLSIETVLIADPGTDQVMVEIEACAICHSDISYMDGGWGGATPVVLGHEAVGRVQQCGPGVSDLREGERVVATLLRACGGCRACASGHPVACTNKPDFAPLRCEDGSSLDQGLRTAGFAEKVVLHRSQVAPVGDDVPPASASFLSCGVATGVGSVVNASQVRPGSTVVVIGAGGVGLNAIQGARIAGAARIVAVDLNTEKLNAAREFGATDCVLATDEKPWRLAASKMKRGADAVFVTVGAISAFESAPRYLDPMGEMIIVGMPHNGETASYQPVILAALSQGFKGVLMGDTVLARDIPWMVDLYEQGRLKLDELVSGLWPLEKINEAIADTRAGKARRNVIMF